MNVRRTCQLLSFNFMYGSTDKKRIVPGVYCLVSGKSLDHYEFVLQKLVNMAESLGVPIKWTSCCTDFEAAIGKALQSKIPSVSKILGCSFHFNQCLYKHIQADAVLLKMYFVSKSVLRVVVRDIMSIAYVPVALVVRVYHKLILYHRNNYPHFFSIDQVGKFLAYFENQWLRDSIIGKWNVFEREGYRTNNNLEGFHLYLQHALGVHRPWWTFVKNLRNVYLYKQLQFESFRDNGKQCGRKRALKQRTKEEVLAAKKNSYLKGDIHSVDRAIHYLQRLREHYFSLTPMVVHDLDHVVSTQSNTPEDVLAANCIDISDISFCDKPFLYVMPGYDVESSSPNVFTDSSTSLISPKIPTLAAGDRITFSTVDARGNYEYLYDTVRSIHNGKVEVGDEPHLLHFFSYVVKDEDLTHAYDRNQVSEEFFEEALQMKVFELIPDEIGGDAGSYDGSVERKRSRCDTISSQCLDMDTYQVSPIQNIIIGRHIDTPLLLMRTKDLSEEELHTAVEALKPPHDDALVRPMKYNQDLTRKKMECLNPGLCINDEIINFYMNMLRDRDSALCEKATTRQPSHFFSTFFMSELLQGGQYTFKNVERWTRARKFTGRRTGVPIDLSSMDKIFVPIHVTDAHWALLVVYCSIKKVVYYDSLRWDGTRYCEAMLQYLAQESRLKRNVSRKRVPVNISEWDHVNAGSSCPMQAKGSLDCGVFTIMCADFVSDDLDLTYNSNDMQSYRLKITAAILRGHLGYA